jgi:hypothetical protein
MTQGTCTANEWAGSATGRRCYRDHFVVEAGLAGFGLAEFGAVAPLDIFEAGPPLGAIFAPPIDFPDIDPDGPSVLPIAGAPLVAFGFAGMGLLGEGTVGDAVCAKAVPPSARATANPAEMARFDDLDEMLM